MRTTSTARSALALSAPVAALAAAQETLAAIVPQSADLAAAKTAVPFGLPATTGTSSDDNAVTQAIATLSHVRRTTARVATAGSTAAAVSTAVEATRGPSASDENVQRLTRRDGYLGFGTAATHRRRTKPSVTRSGSAYSINGDRLYARGDFEGLLSTCVAKNRLMYHWRHRALR